MRPNEVAKLSLSTVLGSLTGITIGWAIRAWRARKIMQILWGVQDEMVHRLTVATTTIMFDHLEPVEPQ